MSTSKPLGHIEHVVVLMFENRSFDNILGGLYPSGPNFDGVPPGWSNPVAPPLLGDLYAFQAAVDDAALIIPFPDPNEDYEDMKEQISDGSMQGFITNYAKALKKHKGDPMTVGNIMQYYQAGNIPITNLLASVYAVSDGYFGSGPVQTWPNRLFTHCATPGCYKGNDGKYYSYLNNVDYPNYNDLDPLSGQLDYPTIFETLDEANSDSSQKAWKVYYDGERPISAFLEYVYDNWNSIEGGNVYAYSSDIPDYADFVYDVSNNSLPTYSFIEPRYQKYSASGSIPPNSNHPGGSTVDEGLPPISINDGEKFLIDVYQTLASNKSLFDKTLLIITYDEHGGLFDHVAPPPATSPFSNSEDFANFPYTMYGPRVPAIFINPYVSTKVFRPPMGQYFDHTSIISTLRNQFASGSKALTPRDSVAPDFSGLIDTSVEPKYVTEFPELDNEIPQAYLDDKEPESYVPPKKAGTVTDAVYRSYLANKGNKEKN